MNPMNSWTVNFWREWSPYLSPLSVLRWRNYQLHETAQPTGTGELTLTLKSPFHSTVSLRKFSSDIATFEEVAIHQVYQDVLRFVPDCKTVIDLGANIGLTSLYLTHHFPACRVLAVEPDPDNFRLLSKNLGSLIAKGTCQAIQAAVWSEEKSLVISDTAEQGEHWMRQVGVASNCNDSRPTVQGLTMQSLLAHSGFAEVDLLKVDIEGAEVELFQGDLSWMKQIRALAIEFHDDTRTRSNFDTHLQAYGFRIADANPHTVVAVKSA